MSKPTPYKATSRIEVDCITHQAGSTVALTPAQAQSLGAAVEPINEQPAPAPAESPAPAKSAKAP